MSEDPREARLPQWAQAKMAGMRRSVRNAEQRAEAVRLDTKPEDSDAVVDPYDEVPIGLGRGIAVQFRLDDGSTVLARVEDGALNVMGSDMIAVRPSSGNVVRIDVSDRRPNRRSERPNG